MGVLVEAGGLLTTIQDGGRTGYQQLGVPQSGAADRDSLAAANLLVDNREDEAALELTLAGPRLRFDADNVVAVTGARMPPRLNGAPFPMYRAVSVRRGDVLTFDACASGCRAYLAFAGGLAVEPVMGSRSTYRKAGIGGFGGRELRPGDRVGFRAPKASLPGMSLRTLPVMDYGAEIELRAVPGPQEDAFTPAGLETFYRARYTVSGQSDRMGCRLEGKAVEHVGDGNIISDGVAPGSVQVPENGMPIIMLADRQPTGGYAKIATVISADLPLIAQCRGGEQVHFRQVTVREAQEAYLARREWLKRMPDRWTRLSVSVREFEITVNGTAYRVLAERLE